MSASARAWITGVGAITPIGLDAPSFWSSLLAGRSGTRRLEHPWLVANEDEFRTRIGAPLPGFDPLAHGLAPKDVKRLDPTSQYAIAATREALLSAGFELEEAEEGEVVRGLDPARATTAVGSGVGGLTTFETVHRQWAVHGVLKGKGFMRYGLPMLIPNAPAANVAIRFGLKGECSALSTACAAGAMSIGDAWRRVTAGEADLAVAGGAEGVLTDLDGLGLQGFDLLRVMSARNDDAEHASRPFDRDRDGFVLGEGAAVLVIESEAHARARGAKALAEIAGYASTCDAHDMMQPAPDGAAVERALRLALARAGARPEEVRYLNAHGTGTEVGDRVEAAAIRRVFGEGPEAPLVSATKSMTGHCIAASGAMEAVATVLSIARGVVHPTLNLDNVADGCDLRHVRGAALPADVPCAISASYGFGGHDAVLVLRRP